MLTISRFSYIILSLTKQLYRDFKLVQRVINNYLSYRIFLIVNLIITLVLNLQTILYTLVTKTLYITYLYLIDNQQKILALLFLFISIIIKLIQDKRSQLLVKDKSINIISLRVLILSYIKQSPQEGLLIYYYSHLLSYFIYSSFGLMTYAIKERLNIASGQQTIAIQAPFAL